MVAIGWGAFWYFGSYSAIPTVIGANFSVEYHKVPYNVKSLDVSFSVPLDPATVTAKTVTISPYVEGKVSVENGNTVRYSLVSPLKVGEEYTLTVAKTVQSAHGVALTRDFIYTFEAVSGAKATKIIPEGKLGNLTQNVVVLFNMPVVPLTSLSNRDTLPCPLQIQPKVEGMCKWTTPTILEFIPKTHFEGATKYNLQVADTKGLMYPLTASLTGTFSTPDQEFIVGTPADPSVNVQAIDAKYIAQSTFRPTDGLHIRALFPVDIAELSKNLSITSMDGKSLVFRIEPIVENKAASESRFIVTLKDKPFEYDTLYGFSLRAGVKTKYGNEPLHDPKAFSIRSTKFYDDIQVHQRIYSETGALIDTKDFADPSKIPSKNVFFQINFAEEVPLESKYFSFRSNAGENIPFTLSYVKEPELLKN